jgi:hypothetical protein
MHDPKREPLSLEQFAREFLQFEPTAAQNALFDLAEQYESAQEFYDEMARSRTIRPRGNGARDFHNLMMEAERRGFTPTAFKEAVREVQRQHDKSTGN